MRLLLISSLVVCCLVLPSPAPVHAQAQTRAYAPENLRTLSYSDQVRVISLEYSEQSRGRRIADDQLRFYTDQVNRSNWTFSRIKQDIAQSLAGGGIGPRPPQPPPVAGGTIRCESTDGRGRTCNTPWRGGSRLVRQLSDSPCVEGRSWQSQQGQVHVGNGCRAEFARAVQIQPPIGDGRNIRCESQDNRSRTCRVPWQGRSRLVRQLSDSPCVEGRTWQSQRGQVYVDKGCRGEFAARGGSLPGPDPISGYSVTCSSFKGASTTCAWDRRHGRPRLSQQISNASCVEGRSWGYTLAIGLWVTSGCSGRFGPH